MNQTQKPLIRHDGKKSGYGWVSLVIALSLLIAGSIQPALGQVGIGFVLGMYIQSEVSK